MRSGSDLQLWILGAQDASAAQTGGADHGACRQRVEAGIFVRDESIARILAP